jgi:hypothetical protein
VLHGSCERLSDDLLRLGQVATHGVQLPDQPVVRRLEDDTHPLNPRLAVSGDGVLRVRAAHGSSPVADDRNPTLHTQTTFDRPARFHPEQFHHPADLSTIWR